MSARFRKLRLALGFLPEPPAADLVGELLPVQPAAAASLLAPIPDGPGFADGELLRNSAALEPQPADQQQLSQPELAPHSQQQQQQQHEGDHERGGAQRKHGSADRGFDFVVIDLFVNKFGVRAVVVCRRRGWNFLLLPTFHDVR